VARVLAIANQKGGVGKTTTVHSLGDALGRAGLRVLLVDLDPQACLTYSVGLDPETVPLTLHDVLAGRASMEDAALELDTFSIVPASIDLAGSEIALVGRTGREHVLGRAMQPVRPRYQVILIDCPPSLGILTINGLTAADRVIVPVQCETLSHRGVGQLLETISDVKTYTRPDLDVLGVVPTMYDARTRHTREVIADVGNRYGLRVLEPAVPRSVRFAEAPASGRSILEHAPESRGAAAYRALADAIYAAA
jgi:chromosome partitioning protein